MLSPKSLANSRLAYAVIVVLNLGEVTTRPREGLIKFCKVTVDAPVAVVVIRRGSGECRLRLS
jgi:hypothetical protein